MRKTTDEAVKDIASGCTALTFVVLIRCKKIKDEAVKAFATGCTAFIC